MTDNPTMFEFSEDIANAEAPDPLPKGTYLATIRSAEGAVDKNGRKYAKVGFYIPTDAYPLDFTDGNPDGTTIFYNFVPLEDNKSSRFRLRQFCEKVGAPVPNKSLDLSSWVNLQANVVITHRDYEGVPQANIASIEKA